MGPWDLLVLSSTPYSYGNVRHLLQSHSTAFLPISQGRGSVLADHYAIFHV